VNNIEKKWLAKWQLCSHINVSQPMAIDENVVM